MANLVARAFRGESGVKRLSPTIKKPAGRCGQRVSCFSVEPSGLFECDFELSLDSPVHISEPADLEEKRKQREADADKQFKGADWRSKPKLGRDAYAADSSPREPQMGDDEYHDGP